MAISEINDKSLAASAVNLATTTVTGILPAANTAANLSPGNNLIINGAMQVAQRSSSAVAQADSSNEGYATLDRWYLQFASACPGTVTTSKSTEAPVGFRSSIKLDCTSTGTPVDNSNDYIRLWQKIEGQDLQGLAYGTSSAKSITLSWYMKSTTYTDPISIHFLAYGSPANEYYNVTVTPTTSWVKYSVTVPGSTSLTFADTNAAGLNIGFTIAGPATPQHTQASSSTAWSTTVSNAVTDIGNLVSSTNNVLYITGVQLESGTVATPFNYRSFGQELALCQRYYQKTYDYATAPATSTENGWAWYGADYDIGITSTFQSQGIRFESTMRAAPTMVGYDASGNSGKCVRYRVGHGPATNIASSIDLISTKNFRHFGQGTNATGNIAFHYTADAEL